MIKTFLQNMGEKHNLADVSAKLLTVELRGSTGPSSSTNGAKSQAFAASCARNRRDKKTIVCYCYAKNGHMERDCLKKKTADAKGRKTPSGGRRGGANGDD